MLYIKSYYLYNLLSKIYHNLLFFFVNWSDFINSIIKFKSKEVIIYYNSIYHFKTFERKKFNLYIKLLTEKFSVVKVNLDSKIMVNLLKIFLKFKKIDKKNNKIFNRNINLKFIKRRIFWDKFNKSNISNLDYLNHVKNRRDYLSMFNKFIKNNDSKINSLNDKSIFH